MELIEGCSFTIKPGYVVQDENEKKIYCFCRRYTDDKIRVNDMIGLRKIWLFNCLQKLDKNLDYAIDDEFYKKYKDTFDLYFVRTPKNFSFFRFK